MATRFGASSPFQIYEIKVRWIMGALLSVIGVLLCTLILVASPAAQANSSTPTSQDTLSNIAPTVNLLVARQRIESGSEIDNSMIDVRPVLAANLPADAITENQRLNIIGSYATELIDAGALIQTAKLSDQKPLNALQIPTGYRAVSILADRRMLVDGFVRPGSRVDIQWTYSNEKNEKNLATIIHFAQILSISGTADRKNNPVVANNQKTTVTVLVSEEDGRYLELAQQMGEIGFSLVGGEEPGKLLAASDPITVRQILKRSLDEPVEEIVDGTIYYTDSESGQRKSLVLVGEKWRAPKK